MIRIGELARRAGVSVRALRYYEEQGLLAAERSEAGQRHYPEEAVDRVRFLQAMYAAGLSSSNIAMLLPCVETGHTTAQQREMLRAERARIHGRIAELRAAMRRLDGIIELTDSHP